MEKRIHSFLPQVKDYYTINDKGEIFSDNSGKMKFRNKKGTEYQLINFMLINGKKQTFRVHRLVMMAFNPIENMNEMEVNHIDGNKKNNSFENLEWCTSKENSRHAVSVGLIKPRFGEQSNFSKLTEDKVKKVFELREKGLLQREIAEIVGCTHSNISAILRGKSWKRLQGSTTI